MSDENVYRMNIESMAMIIRKRRMSAAVMRYQCGTKVGRARLGSLCSILERFLKKRLFSASLFVSAAKSGMIKIRLNAIKSHTPPESPTLNARNAR
jgi:hypothetical protein